MTDDRESILSRVRGALAPLHEHFPPGEIAKRLAWYLANKGSESVLDREQLKRAHFKPNLNDFRLRFGAFDPSGEERDP